MSFDQALTEAFGAPAPNPDRISPPVGDDFYELGLPGSIAPPPDAQRRGGDEARAMLADAAREMLASYRDEGRQPPIGTGHVEQITIDTAA